MFEDYLQKVMKGNDLQTCEMEEAMEAIMEGEISSIKLAGFLVALKMKSESNEEITGAARVMRDKALTVDYSGEVIDTCGTGGDGSDTFNISTAVTFVLAAAGLTVAKHGNRSVSSRSGSADVLEAMGVNLELTPEQVRECMEEVNLGFLFAPVYHKAMKHAVEARKKLGVRTIFNILGPLTNPAAAEYQLLGVYAPDLVEPMAAALRNLGTKRAMVVHGASGLDELSISGKNRAAFLQEEGRIKNITITPEEVGLKRAGIETLSGGGAEKNREIIMSVLAGEKSGPKRDVVLFNAGAAFKIAGEVESVREGVDRAAEAIDSGAALMELKNFVRHTNSFDSVEAVS